MTTRPTETVEPGLHEEGLAYLAPGTMLAERFEIDRPLGAGGYAVVYSARDHELARRIAVKVLRPDRVTPAAVKRLRREVAVARDISAPGIVRLFDIGQHGELSFITMELVEGSSLRTELAKGPLDVAEALRIADAILGALEALHAGGLIHRDLKPANVLVASDRTIKLADFGLARHWEAEAISATATAAVVGTLEYVSPEQALGRDLDPRSDLYSFGVLFYELLAGQLPFGSASSLGAVVAHVTRRPPDIRKVRSDLPAWVAVLLQQLLEKDPERRPPSATAVRSALREKRIDWGYRWRRARLGAVSAAAVALVAVALGAWTWNVHQTRFDRVSSDSRGTLHALDCRGRVLWSRPGLTVGERSAVVRVGDDETRIVGLPLADDGPWDASGDSTRPLLVYDAQSGKEVESLEIPAIASHTFPLPRHYNLASVSAVDVDHDGLQEIVASFVHIPYWPSYTVFIDPRTRESSVILFASGHHRFLGAIDIDDDGTDEILLSGINNRMGWRFGVAAVRLQRSQRNAYGAWLPVHTPDTAWVAETGGPAWYALLPRREAYEAKIDRIDRQARTFDVVFSDNSRERLSFDGFSTGSSSRLSVSLRQQRREAAYQLLRDAGDAESRARPESAISSLALARQAANDATDPELASWIETVQARTLVRLDHPESEVRAAVELALEQGTGGAELCWEVALTYSRKGRPKEAAEWFARGLEMATGVGHLPVDFLRNAVISLAEIGQWDRALALVDGYRTRSSRRKAEGNAIRAFVEWRTGRLPNLPIEIFSTEHKFDNYWPLEVEWAAGVADSEEFLRRVRDLLSRTEEAPWLRSLEADVLASSGRLDEALTIARMAMTEVEKDPEDAFARAHRPVVEERLHRIEALRGQ